VLQEVCPCLLSFSLIRSCRRLTLTSKSGRSWYGEGGDKAAVSAPSAVAGVRVLSVFLLVAADTLRASRHLGLSNPIQTQLALTHVSAALWMALAECAADVLLMAAGFLVALPALRRVAVIRAMRRDAAQRRLAQRRERHTSSVDQDEGCGCLTCPGCPSCCCCGAGAGGYRSRHRHGRDSGGGLPGSRTTQQAAQGCNVPGGLRSAGFVLVHRALRLVPLTAVTLFLEWTVAPLLARGPFWGGWLRLAEACSNWGWAALVFAANAAPAGAQGGFAMHQCVSSAWLLSVEMQLAVVVLPIVLITYKVHASAGLAAVLVMLGAMVGSTAAVVGAFDLHLGPFVAPGAGPGVWGGSGSGAPVATVDLYYVTPWARGSGFLVGVLLAMAWVWMEAGAERAARRRSQRRLAEAARVAASPSAQRQPRRRLGGADRSRQAAVAAAERAHHRSAAASRIKALEAADARGPLGRSSPWCLMLAACVLVAAIAYGGFVRAVASAEAALVESGLAPPHVLAGQHSAAAFANTTAFAGTLGASSPSSSSSSSSALPAGWPQGERASELLFMVLSRPAAATAAALACLACFAGGGGAVRAGLEWPGWQPLARLTYGAVLLEPAVLRVSMLSRTQWVRFSSWQLVGMWLGVLTLTYLGAAVLYLLVEGPAVAIEAAALAACGCAPPEDLTLLSARVAARRSNNRASVEEEEEMLMLEAAMRREAEAGGGTRRGGRDRANPTAAGAPAAGAGDAEGTMHRASSAWWVEDLGSAFMEDADASSSTLPARGNMRGMVNGAADPSDTGDEVRLRM
jgi:hypothetical protein